MPSSPKPMKKDTPETKLLNLKKQIILYGPPGTGKTFGVKSIIENHSGEDYKALKELGRVEFITFHQSYSYEEFIEGIKPILGEDGNITYRVEGGILKVFCESTNENYNLATTDIESLEKIAKFESIIEGLSIGKIFNLRTGKTSFEIVDKNDTELIIKSESINYKNVISLKLSEIEKVYFSKDEIDTNKKSGNLNGYKYGRQEDSYIIAIVDDFKNQTIPIEKPHKVEKQNFYLVIDEINRGNISKIFGELITLLEADKRLGGENEIKSKLPYSKKVFGIPPNLYIIATMNTSDKSIVSLDTALRRRFGFVEMLPRYDLKELQTEIEGIQLAELLKILNQRIEYLLDKDHLIGQSYFLNVKSFDDLKSVFYNEIIPLLEEYFYSDEDKLRLVLGEKFFEKDEQNFVDIFGKESQDFDAQKQRWKLKVIEKITIDDFKVCFNIKNETSGKDEKQ